MNKRIGVAVLAALSLVACKTPMATVFRDEVMPQEPAMKVAAFPLLFPVYAVLTVLDVVVVNPVSGAGNVPTVAGDLWSWHNEPNPWIGYAALMPIKLVAMPVVAVGTVMFSEQFDYGDGS